MTARELAEVCAHITINLISGGVPLELAKLGVTSKLTESYEQNRTIVDEEERRDKVAVELKEEFSFCL